MVYEEAVSILEHALKFGVHPSLDTIQALAVDLDRPQDAFESIQVTGTNGKSSVTRLAAAILDAHGFRTGCYTSPHLSDYRERIEVGAEQITRRAFADSVAAACRAAGNIGVGATEFELLTAAALDAFRRARVDFAVLEVGMGGRWDATSVVSPSVAVITGVSLDHTAHLGNTREQIAADKAHIIKAGSVPVLGPGTAGVEHILIERAEACEAQARAVREAGVSSPLAEEVTARFEILGRPTTPAGTTRIRVEGVHADYGVVAIPAPAYQAANVATAIAAAEAALARPLDAHAIARALVGMRFPARFEALGADPVVVVDGSHNPEAAAVLAGAIRDAFGEERPRVLLGVLADKDARGIVEALAPVASDFGVTAPLSERALCAQDLARIVQGVTGTMPPTWPDVGVALADLSAPGSSPLVVTGSLTTAGEARRFLAASHRLNRG